MVQRIHRRSFEGRYIGAVHVINIHFGIHVSLIHPRVVAGSFIALSHWRSGGFAESSSLVVASEQPQPNIENPKPPPIFRNSADEHSFRCFEESAVRGI
jgi:hypothetical protein